MFLHWCEIFSYNIFFFFELACKFEETYYPAISQLLHLVPNAGKKDDILRIGFFFYVFFYTFFFILFFFFLVFSEQVILDELRFGLGSPTPIIFLKRFAKVFCFYDFFFFCACLSTYCTQIFFFLFFFYFCFFRQLMQIH
jgi:hypothetical protein